MIHIFAYRLCKVNPSWNANKARNIITEKWNYIIWKFQYLFFTMCHKILFIFSAFPT